MREYERRHGDLEVEVRVLEANVENHKLMPMHPEAKVRIELLENALNALVLDYHVFKGQVFAYSGAGAIVGGIIISLLEKVLVHP